MASRNSRWLGTTVLVSDEQMPVVAFRSLVLRGCAVLAAERELALRYAQGQAPCTYNEDITVHAPSLAVANIDQLHSFLG